MSSEKSQYTGDVCHIRFRSQGPLLIPRTILKKCPKLAMRLDKKHIFSKPLDTVDIEDYPFSVGHIIIHYLITDKYQCLKPEGETEDERNCSELATAFKAHAAAVDLELPCLQLMASSEMRRLEAKMSIVLITRTLNDTGLSLDQYPMITSNFVSYVIRLSASLPEECKAEMMYEIGVPENVAMVLVKCILQSKGIKFTQDHASETGPGDEMVSDTNQLEKEAYELLKILRSLDKKHAQVHQSIVETGIREEMARVILTKTILETWEASGGSLSSLQHARLEELQNTSDKLSRDLQVCKIDLAASKERVQKLKTEAKAFMERLTLEDEIQSILERQQQQNGFLSRSDLLRLRSAQSRSNDLSIAASVDPQVHLKTQDSELMSPDQEVESQPDDDGSRTPTRTSYNMRRRQSSKLKDTTDGLDEACARLEDFASETTSTSGRNTPPSTSSDESELCEKVDQWHSNVEDLAAGESDTWLTQDPYFRDM